MPGKRGTVKFKERDVSRLIRAAKTAGLTIYYVEIEDDGTIRVVTEPKNHERHS